MSNADIRDPNRYRLTRSERDGALSVAVALRNEWAAKLNSNPQGDGNIPIGKNSTARN